MEKMVSISISAASLASKRMEGRVKGLLTDGSVSACITDFMASNWDAIEVAMSLSSSLPQLVTIQTMNITVCFCCCCCSCYCSFSPNSPSEDEDENQLRKVLGFLLRDTEAFWRV